MKYPLLWRLVQQVKQQKGTENLILLGIFLVATYSPLIMTISTGVLFDFRNTSSIDTSISIYIYYCYKS